MHGSVSPKCRVVKIVQCNSSCAILYFLYLNLASAVEFNLLIIESIIYLIGYKLNVRVIRVHRSAAARCGFFTKVEL